MRLAEYEILAAVGLVGRVVLTFCAGFVRGYLTEEE